MGEQTAKISFHKSKTMSWKTGRPDFILHLISFQFILLSVLTFKFWDICGTFFSPFKWTSTTMKTLPEEFTQCLCAVLCLVTNRNVLQCHSFQEYNWGETAFWDFTLSLWRCICRLVKSSFAVNRIRLRVVLLIRSVNHTLWSWYFSGDFPSSCESI